VACSEEERRTDDDGDDVCYFERASRGPHLFHLLSADILSARREGQVAYPWGRGGAKAVAHHMPLTTASMSIHPDAYRPSACAGTHEGVGEGQGQQRRRRGRASFCSLLFFSFCSIKRSPLLRRGFAPTAPLKPAASATREILVVQSQGRAARSPLSRWGRRCAASLLLAAAHHPYHHR
jgi:hypothetical protein